MTPVMSEAPETKQCDYTFIKDILHVRGVATFGAELIETAERIALWERASVVQGSGHEHYGAERNNDSVEIAGRVHGDLLRFEHLLAQVFHSCAYAYKALNRHLMLSRDTGYTLLRYQPGQFFHEHIDTIVGHSDYAMRLLSGIIFLNDGFDGGELEFPHQKMKLKPAPGDVLLWPSGFTHPHQAHAIVTGTKFSVVTWFV